MLAFTDKVLKNQTFMKPMKSMSYVVSESNIICLLSNKVWPFLSYNNVASFSR